jgi:hypothetical protein
MITRISKKAINNRFQFEIEFTIPLCQHPYKKLHEGERDSNKYQIYLFVEEISSSEAKVMQLVLFISI